MPEWESQGGGVSAGPFWALRLRNVVTTTGLFPRITHMSIQGMLSIGGATDHVARSDEAFELEEVNLELVHIRLSW